MKKYLMTGIAALAMCIGFTSCSHDITPMTQEEIDQLEAQKIVNDYEAAFVKAFGQPAANQMWGFDISSTRTRSVDVNHNEWYSTADGVDAIYGKLEVDPDVTNEERMGVFRYMNNTNDKEVVENIDVKDYFVSQVWDGGTNYILDNVIYGVPTQRTDDNRKYTNDLNTADGKIDRNNGVSLPESAEYTPLTTSYKNQDGVKVNVPGGDNMDWLFVNETGEGVLGSGTIDKNTGKITGAGGWTHINNFNSANNTDEWYAGKTWMKDPSGTYDFAYNQTDGSYFSHKYVIVPGTAIFAGNQAMLDKYGEFYYVCFDYEKPYTQAEKDNEVTFIWVTPYDRGSKQQRQKVQVEGYYTDDNMPSDEQMEAAVKVLNQNYTSYETTGDEKPSVAGYLYGSQHFEGDDIYTDWIVRISPAKYKGETTRPVVRVFAEDLTAKPEETVAEIDGNSPSDWDFNDVVFDAQYVDATHAKITLWAAGGTLPLRFNEDNNLEVHKLFNVSVKTMVNTHADLPERSWKDNVQEKVFNITIPQSIITEKGGDFNSEKYKDNFPLAVRDLIRIEVQKGGKWYELTAAQGKPASKIATTASKVKWLKEKVDIRLGYPTFKQYVGYPSVNWWSGPVESCLYNVDGNSVQCKWCTE
jgi:hypothetical protein